MMEIKKDRILVIGSLGALGRGLTTKLRLRYGENNVISSDIVSPEKLEDNKGIYEQFNVFDKERLRQVVEKYQVNQIYLLAAILSAKGEANPLFSWDLNTNSLLNVLELAREENIAKVFWPSSIAVFGEGTEMINTPQNGIRDPVTIYGMSKMSGEQWAKYYFSRYGVDVRSVRYPGVIDSLSLPGGGTTDYAMDMFHNALRDKSFQCFLEPDTSLPMLYMSDAIEAAIQIMEAPAEKIKVRTSYNIQGMSFSPEELANKISENVPGFEISYHPDFRQIIANTWPDSIDDMEARNDWGWKPQFDLSSMVDGIFNELKEEYPDSIIDTYSVKITSLIEAIRISFEGLSPKAISTAYPKFYQKLNLRLKEIEIDIEQKKGYNIEVSEDSEELTVLDQHIEELEEMQKEITGYKPEIWRVHKIIVEGEDLRKKKSASKNFILGIVGGIIAGVIGGIIVTYLSKQVF
ncbi:NAD-dependent epimerase/dehydratase family protein [Reichenbachiella sp.]|uniref:NAD-dependent epimerase/dehydratase family protein n=1 Tax=Reichenbachiella sp. TaxID=2184521 RepID=UPI003298411D